MKIYVFGRRGAPIKVVSAISCVVYLNGGFGHSDESSTRNIHTHGDITRRKRDYSPLLGSSASAEAKGKGGKSNLSNLPAGGGVANESS